MTDQLTPKQLEALYMLFDGQSADMTARRLDVSIETLYRWKKLPEFIAEWERLKVDLRHELHDLLLRLSRRSLTTLDSELQNAPRGARGRTALSVLKLLGEGQFALQCVPEEENATPPSEPAGQTPNPPPSAPQP